MSIKTRIRKLIASNTSDRARYVQLKERTGISADIWKNFWFGRREPDAYMVEKLARAWPEYAYWLVTGSTDAENGHRCPDGEISYEIQRSPLTTARAFFEAGIEVEQLVETLLESHPDQHEEIMSAILNFMAGKWAHKMPSKAHLEVDQLFKEVNRFRQAQMLRDKEVEIKATKNDHQAG